MVITPRMAAAERHAHHEAWNHRAQPGLARPWLASSGASEGGAASARALLRQSPARRVELEALPCRSALEISPIVSGTRKYREEIQFDRGCIF
jgi:hypothetical protein